ncbi:MAG: redoxin domain-containing protein [candidate division Zixibacteria bacterium]|nr:redoxin domain-containing protein [candidate division Zixibacteria bacterium]
MKTILTYLFAAVILTLAGATVSAEPTGTTQMAKVGETAPDFTLMDANGKKHSLSDFKGKYVVLEWVNYDCPFVKKHYHSGNMQKLQAEYTEKGAVWLSICSSAPGNQGHFNGEALHSRIKDEKSAASAYLIDESGTVGNLYQAKTTPNMYVVDPKGMLVYAGAIDDTPSTKADDIPGSVNYVAEALKASMAGKKVPVAATQPYGCSVKYSKK